MGLERFIPGIEYDEKRGKKNSAVKRKKYTNNIYKHLKSIMLNCGMCIYID